MTPKDWILLIVPVLCNGVVVLILEKIFEKRRFSIIAKQEYVSVIQQKIDETLSFYINMVQANGEEAEVINYVNQFLSSFVDLFYYYQQNVALFKAICKDMNKAYNIFKEIERTHQEVNNKESNLMLLEQLYKLLLCLYKILQKIQKKCVNCRI